MSEASTTSKLSIDLNSRLRMTFKPRNVTKQYTRTPVAGILENKQIYVIPRAAE